MYKLEKIKAWQNLRYQYHIRKDRIYESTKIKADVRQYTPCAHNTDNSCHQNARMIHHNAHETGTRNNFLSRHHSAQKHNHWGEIKLHDKRKPEHRKIFPLLKAPT